MHYGLAALVTFYCPNSSCIQHAQLPLQDEPLAVSSVGEMIHRTASHPFTIALASQQRCSVCVGPVATLVPEKALIMMG